MIRTYLSNPSKPIPLRAGADVVQTTVHSIPVDYVLPHPLPGETMAHITLLLSFLPDTADRLHLNTLPQSYVDADSQAFYCAQPAADLPHRFSQQPGAFATAAIALPPFSPERFEAVQETLLALRNSHHFFTLIAALSPAPKAWKNLKGVDGWVTCSSGNEAFAVSQLFTALATLTSREKLAEIDDSDVGHALGSIREPAQLLQGLWNCTTQKMEWLGEDPKQRIGRASAAIAFTLTHRPELHDSATIYRTLRALTPSHASVFCSSSLNFLSPGHISNAYPVVILWRS